MNNVIHDYLNKLRLISKLKEGQSLCVKDHVSIYEFNYVNWFWRKLYNDNKNEVARFLQEFYKSIDQSVELLVSDLKNKPKNISVIINLAEKIKLSIHGIENLSKTYNNYPQIVAILEGIIQDYAISSYKQLLENIPVNCRTKYLNDDVMYNETVLYTNKVADSEDTNFNHLTSQG